MTDLETMQEMLKRRGIPYNLYNNFQYNTKTLSYLDLTVDGIQIWFTEDGGLEYLTTNVDWYIDL